MSMIDDVKFWQQVLLDLECTVVCPPDLEFRCKEIVDFYGMSRWVHIQPSPYCPADQLYVLDLPADHTTTNCPVCQHSLLPLEPTGPGRTWPVGNQPGLDPWLRHIEIETDDARLLKRSEQSE